MARRRSRKNVWFGQPLRHRWAALRGIRKSRRKTRRNAGSIAASVKSIPNAATKAFAKKPIADAAALLAGSAATTYVAEKLVGVLPILGSNKVFSVLTKLATAGVVGRMVAPKVPVAKNYAGMIFYGGVLSGVLEGAHAFIPNRYLPRTGLGEDMEGLGWGDVLRGLGDWFVGPYNTSWALPNTEGGNRYPYDPYTMGTGIPGVGNLGAYVGVKTPVGMMGMEDFASNMNPLVHDGGRHFAGLADLAVAQEMDGLV